MTEERTVKKKSRFLWGIVLGLILGFVLSQLMPVWWERYLPTSLRTGHLVVGEVLDKGERADELLLKISTEDGVLLATFTNKVDEINLLVEDGDNITLRVKGYQPFLEDPRIEKVQRPAGYAEAEPPSRREAMQVQVQEKMERDLGGLEEKIAELEKAAEEARSEIEPDARELLEELRAKRDVARQKLNELERSSGPAWEDLRKGMERAWRELEDAFDKAASRFGTESSQS
jgi:uncharacterized membrane protein YccC